VKSLNLTNVVNTVTATTETGTLKPPSTPPKEDNTASQVTAPDSGRKLRNGKITPRKSYERPRLSAEPLIKQMVQGTINLIETIAPINQIVSEPVVTNETEAVGTTEKFVDATNTNEVTTISDNNNNDNAGILVETKVEDITNNINSTITEDSEDFIGPPNESSVTDIITTNINDVINLINSTANATTINQGTTEIEPIIVQTTLDNDTVEANIVSEVTPLVNILQV